MTRDLAILAVGIGLGVLWPLWIVFAACAVSIVTTAIAAVVIWARGGR